MEDKSSHLKSDIIHGSTTSSTNTREHADGRFSSDSTRHELSKAIEPESTLSSPVGLRSRKSTIFTNSIDGDISLYSKAKTRNRNGSSVRSSTDNEDCDGDIELDEGLSAMKNPEKQDSKVLLLLLDKMEKKVQLLKSRYERRSNRKRIRSSTNSSNNSIIEQQQEHNSKGLRQDSSSSFEQDGKLVHTYMAMNQKVEDSLGVKNGKSFKTFKPYDIPVITSIRMCIHTFVQSACV